MLRVYSEAIASDNVTCLPCPSVALTSRLCDLRHNAYIYFGIVFGPDGWCLNGLPGVFKRDIGDLVVRPLYSDVFPFSR